MKGNDGQKLENGAKPDAAKFFVWDLGETDRFWQLVVGTPQASHQKAEMQGNEGPKGQNERK